jgi:shikimate dehydrogenase
MKIFAVLGDPISHSLSPAMQNAALKALGLDAQYLSFRVAKENLRDALLGARAMGFSGLNLTIPLKETALEIVIADDLARAIGAVNTVSFGGDAKNEIKGYNTDGFGALMALEMEGAKIRDSRALIVGAGGASRAIAYTLSRKGAQVSIANRSRARAMELADRVEGKGFGLDDLDRLVPRADILINTTSVGMKEGDPSLIDESWLRPGQIVFDTIYNRRTELLEGASRAKAVAIDGVAMLVYQGAKALEIWTGLKAPADVMDSAVRDALREREKAKTS